MAKLVIEFDEDASQHMSPTMWEILLDGVENRVLGYFSNQEYDMKLTEDE